MYKFPVIKYNGLNLSEHTKCILSYHPIYYNIESIKEKPSYNKIRYVPCINQKFNGIMIEMDKKLMMRNIVYKFKINGVDRNGRYHPNILNITLDKKLNKNGIGIITSL